MPRLAGLLRLRNAQQASPEMQSATLALVAEELRGAVAPGRPELGPDVGASVHRPAAVPARGDAADHVLDARAMLGHPLGIFLFLDKI